MKPTLFIGSSSEALPVAEAIFSILERRDIEPTLWNQGVFGLNTSGLESLLGACRSYDYACLVLRKDDVARLRGKLVHTVRDNVILELGLFLGALGRDRVFVVFERGNRPDLPSDLEGINFLDYDSERADKNLARALTAPCLVISDKIKQRRLTARENLARDPGRHFRISPLDDENSRYWNTTERMNRCRKAEVVRFISITGKNFLLPAYQQGEKVASRLGPRVLSHGVKLRGIVQDPAGIEAEFRSRIETPNASREHRLLMQDAEAVANLPSYYQEIYGLGPSIVENLELKFSPVGLQFGLWLFSDVAFMEPFHFAKRRDVPHLCGFAQLAVSKGSEEFILLARHFEVLWTHGEYVHWCRRRDGD